MALRRALAKRLNNTLKRDPLPSVTGLDHSQNHSTPTKTSKISPVPAKSPESIDSALFRRFLQKREINHAARLPEFLSIPMGDKLREKLRSMNVTGERIRFEGLAPPAPATETADFPAETMGRITVNDARKILRFSQLEKVRSRLREIPMNSISYSKFVEICSEVCSNREQGLEFAKMLDESGSVIVFSDVVLLRPHQVAKSMDKIISESIASSNDPRRRELENMEKQKALIDQKAQSLVKGELYCGLGFLILQTLGFMRLTFWELSWDVMEPICFFVTSFHFALAYGFFLRTSKEPTFEGFFQRRFKVKQKKLIKIHNFDLEKYNKLREAFYPTYYNQPYYGFSSSSIMQEV
ncbi:calcium uniporter protein 4, mitochondrial-like [Nicotiana tomentosiformis]|uniref:calcium uniporter protein 4, mitochondrial-like n=1 Tax=Nicotiana tomentosiformis TaxID=4098 RepID=UPI00051BFE29|nr:calcium uniporter protein 4, mitochondrial-like [Nicotiana tomentosiformis]